MRTVLILTALALIPTACGGTETTAARANEATVIAAFYPLAWAAERVGDASVDVTNLTPPGSEPHDVELSARDVERIRGADVVLYLGQGFQPAVAEAAEGARGNAIDLLSGLDLRAGEEGDDEGAGELDPHVWLDPLRFARLVERVGRALGRPEAGDVLAAELRGLDREFRTGLRSCERRELVTSHAAFGYLAERYGLDQIAITRISPEAEPTARDLEHVVDEVRKHGATTVFFETLVSPRLARTVAREVGAETAVLNPLEGLTDEETARGEDYFSIMRGNLDVLREALGCR
jgi:zinc transport system substrate-binding protein